MTTKQHSTPPAKRRSLFANILLVIGLGMVLGAECYFGYQLSAVSKQHEQIKEDYTMVNHITFGVFSIDLWREQLSKIVTGKIKGYKVTADQKEDIRVEVEEQLHGMIDNVVKRFTKKQTSLGGKLKKFAFKEFVDPKELHAEVPGFSKLIVDRITSKATTNKLKDIATSKFEDLADQTYDSTKLAINAVTKAMYTKYKVANAVAFNKQIETNLNEMRTKSYHYAYGMLGCIVLVLIVWLLIRKQPHLHTALFIMSLLMAAGLLYIGTTVSIIEVDARLSTFELKVMGEKIHFDNQVIFYQSKSIVGVAKALVAQAKPDSVTVGVLLILFVIILPLLRITARGIHMLCKPPIAENKVTRYLAFEASKWDMADVMVIGILMTYIGLNGILQSQLGDLNINNDDLTTATVNNTSLQPGYIIFVGYVVFGMLLSYMLKKIVAQRCAVEEVKAES